MEDRARVFDIVARLVTMPLHQYSRYFERYIALSKDQPLDKIAPVNITSQIRAEVERAGTKPDDIEREIRAKLEAYHFDRFNHIQAEVTKRWTYEQGIKRPYYHVTDLDEEQLTNWAKYLDFEEAEGDYARIKFLYERCLVTAANIDEFWFRYARWLAAQKGKQEEVRNVYQRASCIYVPISRPAIRLHYANFEESQERINVAIAIHEAILAHLPSHLETIKSLVNLHRRQFGVGAAVEVVKQYAESPDCNTQTRGALVAEWARILWRSTGDSDGARKLFQSTQNQFLDCQPFWSSWLSFEIDQPTTESEEPNRHERIKTVHQAIRQKSTLPVSLFKLLSGRYIQYLEERGGKDTTTELLKLDIEINGPVSVQSQAVGMTADKNGHLS